MVAKRQRAVHVVVHVARAGLALRAPVVEWEPQDEAAARLQDPAQLAELVQWGERVLERVVRDHHVGHRIAQLARGLEHTHSARLARAPRRRIRLDTHAFSGVQAGQ
jgi:hypothetical protein